MEGGGGGELENYSDATVHEDLAYVLLDPTTLRVIDRKGRQTRALSFNSAVLSRYSPVVSPHEQGFRGYVAAPNGITALDLTP